MLPTIAARGTGVPELVAAMDKHYTMLTETGKLAERRKDRVAIRTREVVERAVRRLVAVELKDVDESASPYETAAQIVARLNGSVAYGRS